MHEVYDQNLLIKNKCIVKKQQRNRNVSQDDQDENCLSVIKNDISILMED